MGARLPAGVNKPRSHTFRVFFVSEPLLFHSFLFRFLSFFFRSPLRNLSIQTSHPGGCDFLARNVFGESYIEIKLSI